MVKTICATSGCPVTTDNPDYKHVTWHRIPNDQRKDAWLRAIQRPDLAAKMGTRTRRHYVVCSLHFEPWLFKQGKKFKRIRYGAIPTLNLPRPDEAMDPVPTTSAAISPIEGKLNLDFCKREIEDDFTIHEEDIEDKLENRKRKQEADVLADVAKRIKTESPNHEVFSEDIDPPQPSNSKDSEVLKTRASYVDICSHLVKSKEVLTVDINRDNDIFPVDFMRSVLNSQEEILTVLKNQVLLQNPDHGLLTFLRLIGAKLSRFNRIKRAGIENAIVDLINKNEPK